jgi:outer membrane protein TolC
MTRRALTASVLTWLVIGAPVHAADLLTFARTIELGAERGLGVATSRSRVEQARLQIASTKAGGGPSLSLSSSAFSFKQIDSNAILGLGGGFGGMGGLGLGGLGMMGMGGMGGFGGGGGGAFTLLTTSLSLNQTVFDGHSLEDNMAIARDGLDLAEIDGLQQVRRAQFEAAQAYLQVLRARSLRHVALEGVAQARSHVESATLREKAGTGTRFEVLQAETQVASALGQLRAASSQLDIARLGLENLLAEPLGDRELEESIPLPRLAFDPASGLDEALGRRLELLSLTRKRELDGHAMTLAQHGTLPRASVGASYQQQGLGTGRAINVTGSLQWSLWDNGRTALQVARAAEDRHQTDLTLEQTRRGLTLEIRSALLGRQDATERLAIAQRGLVLSQESHRLAEVRYRAGVGTGFEVIDAQAALVQAQNTLVQARYDLLAAEVRLAQALGCDLGDVVATGKRN